MSMILGNNVRSVDFSKRPPVRSGGVAAVVPLFRVAETTTMQKRGSVYPPYAITEAPGSTIYRLRQAHGWSQRELAEKCHPEIDHTTIRRLELNQGFTQDTLERVAKALGVRVGDLFLPPELSEWAALPEQIKQRLAESIQDAAHRYVASKKSKQN